LTDSLHGLKNLLDRARRRHLTQLILEQAGIALCAALGGVVLLLLLGTQILDWYWLVAVFAVTFGFGLWRIRRLTPSRYRLAQMIDGRLQLHDTLSTAFIYDTGVRKADADLLDYQRHQAEKLASEVDARNVFPMRVPKALYAVGGVALVAFGMFAVRYGVTQSLDLKPSLVKIAFESVWKTDERTPPEQKNAFQRAIEEQLKKMGIDLGTEQNQELDAAAENALDTIDTPDVNNSSSEMAQAKGASVNEDQQPGEGEGAEDGDPNAGEEEPAGADEKPQAQGPQQAKNDGAQKGSDKQANEKNSLMDRMRDAMASLLNKMKMQPQGSESKQQMAQNAQKKSGSQGQKGQKSEGKPDGNAQQSPDQQGDQQGEGDQSQTAQGKAGDRSADQQASNDSKSGMGKDDGDKSAREAEQLAAMGKLSELLGKRSKDVSGELLVEVAGGNQQLKTAYSGKTGAHADVGGEITRDEVPLMYRDFVQQYFEQVRRTPPPGAAKPKSAQAAPAAKPTGVSQ
jgi:hypothetical protein